MIGDDKDIHKCRTCETEFTIEGYNIDEDISFCPYCGHVIDSELDEEFYDDDNID